ncbi:energy-coupling factor transporter transmembrane protein EcfT [Brucepastera parasyntrophica]|uniref:energy-coupling factor transporter transmembrane protein EcfT n=1 Tax=Brucepastera parasyntrophica TaxID=2880008 RepID=UPI00210984D9|nr:energy-coupling factor transporter transmembrane protein EcfT [Brucepastera parasyntrophica]ULQ59780.1 energy-coupling factor transporter transmembrane protein EcfT [Brucepastera parasyntrophica]
MKQKAYIPLFQYRPAKTFLHRIPAGWKFAFLIAFTIVIFRLNALIIAILAGIMLALTFAVRTPFSVFARNMRIILWYGLFIMLFGLAGKTYDALIFLDELKRSGLYILRLAAVLLASSLFYQTTSGMEIRYTFSGIQDVLQKIVSCIFFPVKKITGKQVKLPDIAFLLSLTITFIPRLFSAWSGLNQAWDAREVLLKREFPAHGTGLPRWSRSLLREFWQKRRKQLTQ